MAKFVAISGPSATGKTSLIDELTHYRELSNVVFLPDIFSTVWNDLVEKELFSEFEDVSRDPEFLCVFIQRLIDYYKDCIEAYKDKDTLVIMDSCWIDLSVYSVINMWYSHILKSVQEGLLYQLSKYEEDMVRVYITSFDESKHHVEKYRIPFKRYNVKYNRELEIQYYHLASHFDNAIELPTSDLSDAAMFIIEDLQNLGHL